MKKSILCAAAIGMLALTSCDTTGDQATMTRNFNVSTYNLVTPLTSEGSIQVTPSTYAISFEYYAAKAKFQVTDLEYQPGVKTSFLSDEISGYAYNYNATDGKQYNAVQFSANNIAMQSGPALTSLNCTITDAYVTNSTTLPDMTKPIYAPLYAGFNYILDGKYRVRTFWPNTCFIGETVSHGTDMSGNEFSGVTSTGTTYRVVMKLDDKAAYKADVYLVDFQLVTGMPKINIVVQDLDLKFTADGYEISGANVIPGTIEDSAITPTPRYVFNSFALECSGDLSRATGSYTVAGKYGATFSVNCIYQAAKEEK